MKPSPGQPSPATETPRRRFSNIQIFSSLKHRDFRLLLGGTFFVSAGQWIQQITLGWLSYNLTGSPFLVGAIMGVRSIPFLLSGPVAGVLGDRFDRKMILLSTQVVTGILALALAIILATGQVQVWHLFAFSFLSGAAWSFMQPVRMVLVSNVVPREDMMNAIALNSAIFNFNRALGPAIGGLFIAYFGPALNFFLQSAMSLGVLAFIIPLRVRREEHSSVKEASLFSNFVEGIRYIAGNRTILALLVVALVPSLFVMPFNHALLPVFAEEVLDAGPGGLGLLLSAAGVGGFLGTIVVASLGNYQRKGLLILGGSIVGGMAMMVFSQMTQLPLGMLFLGVVFAGEMLFRVTNNTLIQTITPDQYRSRVMSLFMMDHGLVPLGSLLAGTLAEFYGSPMAILFAGTVSVVLVWAIAIKFPILRKA